MSCHTPCGQMHGRPRLIGALLGRSYDPRRAFHGTRNIDIQFSHGDPRSRAHAGANPRARTSSRAGANSTAVESAPFRLAVWIWLVGDVRREVKPPRPAGELTLFQAVDPVAAKGAAGWVTPPGSRFACWPSVSTPSANAAARRPVDLASRTRSAALGQPSLVVVVKLF